MRDQAPRRPADQAVRQHSAPAGAQAAPAGSQPPAGPGALAARRPGQPRPDARPMRIVIGMTGLAAATAMATAIAAPRPPATTVTTVVTTDTQPAPSVLHVTHYVQLGPGETPPPQAVVQVVPTPQPRVVVVTTTRQSGKP
jgi:hypothetical protein